VTETPNEPIRDEEAEPDNAYLVPDEESDFDPQDVADDSTPDPGPGFVDKEVQDDGQD
jgi:hypothetical protein